MDSERIGVQILVRPSVYSRYVMGLNFQGRRGTIEPICVESAVKHQPTIYVPSITDVKAVLVKLCQKVTGVWVFIAHGNK